MLSEARQHWAVRASQGSVETLAALTICSGCAGAMTLLPVRQISVR